MKNEIKLKEILRLLIPFFIGLIVATGIVIFVICQIPPLGWFALLTGIVVASALFLHDEYIQMRRMSSRLDKYYKDTLAKQDDIVRRLRYIESHIENEDAQDQ